VIRGTLDYTLPATVLFLRVCVFCFCVVHVLVSRLHNGNFRFAEFGFFVPYHALVLEHLLRQCADQAGFEFDDAQKGTAKYLDTLRYSPVFFHKSVPPLVRHVICMVLDTEHGVTNTRGLLVTGGLNVFICVSVFFLSLDGI